MRLLLVEDSEDDAALLVRELTRSGIAVDHRRVDNEADLEAALREERWDAVITDYGLPGTDGAAVLRLLREHAFAGPIIAMSGSLSEEQLIEAMRGGAHDFIHKSRLARLGPALVRE